MLPVLFALALAAPPSSALSGDAGKLSWTVAAQGDEVVIDGRSPRWTVHHVADAQLRPVRTERTADGRTVVLVYAPGRVTVEIDGRTVVHEAHDIWDGDTLDVRLGSLVASKNSPARVFQAVDSASGKLYRFDSQDLGLETCGARPCRHVLVQLTGLYRFVGPSFHYWYADDGRLLKFEGPIGVYSAADAR
jgi:hypothetical protein